MTVQIMWKIPAWAMTFQLPQQILIIRIASQQASFQISHLIVTVEFTQLDHPVSCENTKCYPHIQIIT